MTDATETPTSEESPQYVPVRRRRWHLAIALTILPFLVIAALVIGGAWLLKQDTGSAWLLRQIPSLQVDSPRGAVLGDFAARRLVFTLPGNGGRDRITIDGLQWQGLTLGWSPSPQLWGRLHIDRLHADAVDVAIAPSPSAPAAKPPTNLAVPLGLSVSQLEIDQLTLSALPGRPMQGIRGSVDLSAEAGAVHRVRIDALQWEQLRLAGRASVGTSGPMTVDAAMDLQPTVKDSSLPDWRGGLKLSGPLLKLEVQAQSEAAGQSLAAQLRIEPFAPWPLAAFNARVESLDLSALMKDLPRTALSGTAELQSSGWNQAATVKVQISNAAAGRWDQHKLPVQRLKLDIQARPDQPESLRLDAFDVLLGSAAAPGGSISGTGQLQPDRNWTLTTNLSGLRPAALDARAAPLLLSGSATVKGSLALRESPLTLTAKLSGNAPISKGKAATPLSIDVQASLEGQQLHLAQAKIESGRARVEASGDVTLPSGTGNGWRAEAKAVLQDFDPRLFYAGTPGSVWQRGATMLNAMASLQLQEDKTRPLLPRGSVQMLIQQPSLLAGVPLSGKLEYVHAAGSDASLSSQLDAGENHVVAVSRLPEAGPGLISISSQVELQLPRLAGLSPLLALGAGPGTQLGGAADGKFGLELQQGKDQRWLASSDGVLTLRDLKLDSGATSATSLKEGKLRWAAGSKADSPVSLNLQLDHLAAPGALLTQASLDLQGTWTAHQLKLALQGQAGKAPATELTATLAGSISGSPVLAMQDQTALAWKLHIGQLHARTVLPPELAAQGLTPKPQAPLLSAADLDLQMQLGSGLALTGASMAPGQLELSGARLRWTELRWQAPLNQGERADVRAELQLDPLPVAPLLARLQPDFGWGGSLVIAGHASVRTSPGLQIDAVLERSEGDLTVTDERGPQSLGLTDLRVALNTRDGLWQFTQALAGRNMGSLGGVVSIHADRNALWPPPASKIDGVLQANVARLGTWGAWVPAGWRLGGSLSAGMQLGGTFGGPELLGQASGEKLSLRNPLLGIDVTDGAFALSLNGTTARLTSLSARAGKGEVQAQGEAKLGEQATAKLSLKADHFALLNRVDRRLLASGQAELDLGPQLLKLDGNFTVDEGLFDLSRGEAPSLDDDVKVIRADQPPVDTSAKPAAKANERKTRVQLAIDLGQDLKVRGHGLDSRLRGKLLLTQTDNAPPALTGTVTTDGGTYAAYGQKLEVERGEITFTGAFDNPRLDVLAIRPDTDTRVGVAVTGTALSPRIKLFSDPDMADTDKLSWLLLGRAPDGLGRTDTALLQRAALALLSGEGESTSGKIIKNIGLDELSLAQSDDTTQGTIVRLGKQISRRWYVGYERGLNATTGSWQLIYRIAQRFTLRAQSGEDNALDLIWQWKWE